MIESISNEAREVLDFWFGAPGSPEHGTKREAWFKKSPEFDASIREHFMSLWELARGGALTHWDAQPRSLLAYIVLCDQFPRNMFREDGRAYATDPHALAAARRMVARHWDMAVTPVERVFIYLPYEHAENSVDQGESIVLFRALNSDASPNGQLDYALRHQAVVRRFGRFPHRNAMLGRASTSAEIEFLKTPAAPY